MERMNYCLVIDSTKGTRGGGRQREVAAKKTHCLVEAAIAMQNHSSFTFEDMRDTIIEAKYVNYLLRPFAKLTSRVIRSFN